MVWRVKFFFQSLQLCFWPNLVSSWLKNPPNPPSFIRLAIFHSPAFCPFLITIMPCWLRSFGLNGMQLCIGHRAANAGFFSETLGNLNGRDFRKWKTEGNSPRCGTRENTSEHSWNEMKHLFPFYFETTFFLLLRARLSELFDVLILAS